MATLIYDRRSGMLSRGSKALGLCYSGNGAGLNNPEMDSVVNTGPLPAGDYTLATVGPAELATMKKGPNVFRLIAAPGTEMHGRAGFLIHWDNIRQDFSASEGCIVPVMSITWQRIHDGDTLKVI